MSMASERQIAANRLNARKSTGPLSRAGKRRASGNAYRHGLASSRNPDAATATKLDQLAHEIAGDSQSEVILELARSAAEAHFDLARARLACQGLINRVFVDGTVDPIADQLAKKPAERMPTLPSERTAEAIRRALPELVKLNRYEVRAGSRRNRAVKEIIKIKSTSNRLV
jgi:hypothetical protein